MRSDLTGLAITTAAPALAAAIDELTGELLRFGKDAGRFVDAVALDPDCAIANSLAAALHLFTMSRAGLARATPFLAQARARARFGDARERLFVAAVDDWAQGRPAAATARHRAILERWPTDLLSLKLVTYHQFNRGAFAEMLATVEAVLPANTHVPQMHGIHAFALGQCGRHREAEAAGRLGSRLAADPWAQHAVAHVLDLAGAHEEGSNFLAAHQADWDDCSSFLFTHNWWHAALFRLALEDGEGALRLYDERVWSRRRDYCQDQVNAAALLARLDLAGIDTGDRWTELADNVAPNAHDHVNGFVDLHFVLALARAGRERDLADALRGLDHWCAGGGAHEPDVAAALGLAACGLAAWGRGDHARAARLLSEVRGRLVLLGGSDVQREMFDLILIDALRRSGDLVGARRLDKTRTGIRAQAAWQRRSVAAGCELPPRQRQVRA